MHFSTRSRTARTLAVAALGALAACGGDATGVRPGQVPAAAVTAAATQVQAITSDPTITALLSPMMSGGVYQRSGQGALFSRVTTTAVRFATVPSQPRFLFGPDAGLVIPADYRGKVYKHDASNQYVVDPSVSGPANGFRLMLYPYDASATAGQEWGTTPIGYADVTDEGTSITQKIVVNVFANSVANPVFSFKLVQAALAGGATADSIAGTIRAANAKTMTYVFADRTNGPEGTTQRVTTTMDVDVPSANLQIDGTFVDGAVTTSDVQTLTTTVNGDAIRFTTAMVSSQGEIVESDTTNIDVNGRPAGYIVYSTGAQPEFHSPDGGAMSPEAKAALLQLEGVYEQVFTLIAVSALFGFWAIALGFVIV